MTETRDSGLRGALLSVCVSLQVVFVLSGISLMTREGFLPVPVRKTLGRHSDWLSLGHVHFPGPMAVVRGMGYCDWPESESHVQTCGQEGKEY